MSGVGARIAGEAAYWRSLWRADRVATSGAPLLVVLAAVSTWLTMTATGQVVTAVVDRDDAVWRWLALALLGMVGQPVAMSLIDAVAARHQAAVTTRRHRRLAEAALTPHGIGHLEDPRLAGELAAIAEHSRSAVGLEEISSTWRVLTTRATGVASVLVVASWSWWAALALVVMYRLNGVAFAGYLEALTSAQFNEQSVPRRRARYLLGWLVGRESAKEIRLFGLSPWVLRTYTAVREDTISQAVDQRRPALRTGLWAGLALGVGLCAVFGWLAHDVWVGAVSLGLVVSVAQGVDGMQAFGPLGDDTVYAARARASEERVDVLVERGRLGHEGSPTREMGTGAATVDFDDVAFTYPARSEPTLRGLSLHIRAGQSVAIVGVNGVGKSTLVKLLCGLYAPDSGTVRVDGADPAADDEVRRRVAVIFQDFVRYQLSLRDNITMAGEPECAEVQRALADAAGSDVLARVEGRWETVLDPGYTGGTDLSGGQWQRVALARALTAVRRGAGVLVLDEPTAALDVRAEAEIFDRFLDVTQGVTTILVSHRLSSVRHADRIVVLGPRGVVEDGSHDELLTAGGEYAAMFRLQASRFEAAGATS